MSIIEFLQGFLGKGFLGFFLFMSSLGHWLIYFILGSLYYWLISPRYGRQLILIFTLSMISNSLLKDFFHAPRPYVLNPDVATVEASHTAAYESFPSGHAQGITTFWGAIACFHHKVWLWIFSVTMIFLVCLSRMYLGVHFPRDVAAGILLGILWIVIGLWVSRNEKLVQYQFWQKISFWIVGGIVAIIFHPATEVIGIFFGFFPLPSTPFTPPTKGKDKLILGIMGFSVFTVSYKLLEQLPLFFPQFALVDYLHLLAIALTVTELVPWLWRQVERVR